VRHIGDVDSDLVAPLAHVPDGQRVVVILRVLGIDRQHELVTQVFAARALARTGLAERCRLLLDRGGEPRTEPVLRGDGVIVPFGAIVGAEHLDEPGPLLAVDLGDAEVAVVGLGGAAPGEVDAAGPAALGGIE
jgi:hypothetical protein